MASSTDGIWLCSQWYRPLWFFMPKRSRRSWFVTYSSSAECGVGNPSGSGANASRRAAFSSGEVPTM